MKPSVSYKGILKKSLKDPAFAAGYITTALEEGDWDGFLLALRNVAEFQGGLSKLARRSHLHRVHLYRMLSKNGNPGMRNLLTILHAMGFHLTVDAPTKFKRAA